VNNKYSVENNYIIIYVTQQNGNKHSVYVDLEDMDIIKNYKWHVSYQKNIDAYYAETTIYKGIINGKPKYEVVKMHKLILGIERKNRNMIVDHENHNSLDNRKSNLRVTSNDKNTKHRSGKNSNNTSGYRNVSKVGKWWFVQLQIDGENKILGKFPLDQLEEAG
jgi:dihydrofolate reductase